MSGQGKVKTFIYPNMIVRVHSPDLTAEENEAQLKRIKKAAEELLKEKIRGEKSETNKC